MRLNPFQKHRGQVDIISILVIISVLLIMITSTSILTSTGGEGTLTRRLGTEAYYVADSCLEDTLIQLRSNPDYSGTDLNIANGFCTIAVTDDGGDQKTINVTANVFDEYYANLEAVIELVQTSEITRLTLQSKTFN